MPRGSHFPRLPPPRNRFTLDEPRGQCREQDSQKYRVRFSRDKRLRLRLSRSSGDPRSGSQWAFPLAYRFLSGDRGCSARGGEKRPTPVSTIVINGSRGRAGSLTGPLREKYDESIAVRCPAWAGQSRTHARTRRAILRGEHCARAGSRLSMINQSGLVSVVSPRSPAVRIHSLICQFASRPSSSARPIVTVVRQIGTA